MKINHIGMAVPSIEAFLIDNHVLYSGFSRGPLVTNDVQGVSEMFITDGCTVVELLEPSNANSPIAGFLKRNPAGGLVHLALDVDDLDATLETVREAGGRAVVEPVPDVAFDGRRIAFVFLNGHITELIERRAAAPESGGEE